MDIDRIAKRFGPLVARSPHVGARGGLRGLPGLGPYTAAAVAAK